MQSWGPVEGLFESPDRAWLQEMLQRMGHSCIRKGSSTGRRLHIRYPTAIGQLRPLAVLGGIPPNRAVARSAASELGGGRLRIVRNRLTEANPWLCTGCPDIQHRLKLRRIVQRRETDGHNFWSSLATREHRRAAVGAKAASREPATASTNRVCLWRAGDRHIRHPHDEAGSERSATRALAVQAVAVERRNRRARAYIADRSACTPAGKWSSHIVVSSCRRTHFHWPLTDAPQVTPGAAQGR